MRYDDEDDNERKGPTEHEKMVAELDVLVGLLPDAGPPRDTTKHIVGYIAEGNTIETSAQCAGISRKTFYEWMKRGRKCDHGFKEFADVVDIARAMAQRLHVRVVTTAAMNGAYQASMWWLACRAPKDWGRKDQLTVEQKKTRAIDVSQMSDEELMKLIDRGERGEDLDTPEEEPVEDIDGENES